MSYVKHNWVVGTDPITTKNLNELDSQVASLAGGTVPSGSATEGQVLTADGDGGTTWEDIEIDETNIASETTDSGKVLTANGNGGTVWQYPNATNFNSGSATSGQFLVANGSGGVTWVSVPNANGQSF